MASYWTVAGGNSKPFRESRWFAIDFILPPPE